MRFSTKCRKQSTVTGAVPPLSPSQTRTFVSFYFFCVSSVRSLVLLWPNFVERYSRGRSGCVVGVSAWGTLRTHTNVVHSVLMSVSTAKRTSIQPASDSVRCDKQCILHLYDCV